MRATNGGVRRSAVAGAKIVLFAILGLTIAGGANAADGVLEINQTCAEETGCFPGDAAGLPVTIRAPGSYRLTGNLITPNVQTSGVVIDNSNVSLDLGGFAIVRADCIDLGVFDECPRTTVASHGVNASHFRNIHVHDGAIVGMGLRGVSVGSGSIVERIRTRSTGGIGIAAGSASIVRDCTSTDNTWEGIHGGPASVIIGNTVLRNHRDGIRAYPGARVVGNTSLENGGFGLNVDEGVGYRENILTDNVGGTVTGGVNLFSNLCDGSTNCP